jgi:release factor glutamine methyltransferase
LTKDDRVGARTAPDGLTGADAGGAGGAGGGRSDPAEDPGTTRGAALAAVADKVGSVREARWIVDHAGPEQAEALADRRAAGEPLQYVLGRWPFRSIELAVDRRVLIPRPETEWVVGVALGQLERSDLPAGACGPAPAADGPKSSPTRVCVDLGTGSGAIALSLALEGGRDHPGLEVWATDASADALAVAADNLRGLARLDRAAAERVRLARGSWFEALPDRLAGQVDLVVSNPPYVSEEEYGELDPTVRDWEPRGALVAAGGSGGVGGMADIETIVSRSPGWLRRTGSLVVEISPGQARAAMEIARRSGFERVTVERDLADRPRALVAGW